VGVHNFSKEKSLRLKNTTNNSIDGTMGDWEFVEGDENLYLINRLNNKKYKINLTEVS
tara:strand:- start:144 stop:317 length:174 start_codon:yes stop_codon:yes gene_type:complete